MRSNGDFYKCMPLWMCVYFSNFLNCMQESMGHGHESGTDFRFNMRSRDVSIYWVI